MLFFLICKFDLYRLLVAPSEKHQEAHEHKTIERENDNLLPPDVNLLSENQVISQQPSLRGNLQKLTN